MKKGKIFASFILVITFIVTMLIAPTCEGITWSPDEARLTTYYHFDIIPTGTQMKDGRIWVVWTRNILGDYQLLYNIFDGTNWLGEKVLTRNPAADTGASILQTRDGKIWVVWASDRTGGNYSIYYVTSSDNGQHWSEELPLVTSSTGDNLAPQIFQAYNGTVWLVWESSRIEESDDIYYKTYDGTNWSEERRLTTDPWFDRCPSIAEIYIGKIWIIWASDREPSGYWQLFYKNYDGVSWSDDTKLTTDDAKMNTDPSIFWTVDTKTLYIFWSMRKPTSTATDDVYYKYSLDGGLTWSTNTQFTTDSYDDMWSYGGQAKVNARNVWIFWTSNRYDQPDGNYEILYRKSVAIIGDVNGDLSVTVMDLALVGKSYGKRIPSLTFNPAADLNNDGKIWVEDLATVGKYYGTSA